MEEKAVLYHGFGEALFLTINGERTLRMETAHPEKEGEVEVVWYVATEDGFIGYNDMDKVNELEAQYDAWAEEQNLAIEAQQRKLLDALFPIPPAATKNETIN